MENIQTQQDLHQAILQLEQQQMIEKEALILQLQETYSSMQPINVLNNFIAEVNQSESLKRNLFKACVALAIGFIAKKIFESFLANTKTPIVLLIGLFMQFIVVSLFAKDGTMIKNIALHFYKLITENNQQLLSSNNK
jgi:hypothetical protein